MQTSPSKFSRVIGFDRKTHQQALHLQNAGTPARLLSANEKDGKLFVSQYTTVAKANSNDITFESQQPSTSSDNSDLPSVTATEIKLNQLHSLTRNQRVNVKATITLGTTKPKEVAKRNGEKGLVKEDCIIEDDTGNATLHVWDEMIQMCENSKSYEIKDLSVKNYSGHTRLGTTVTTSMKEITMNIENLKGPELLSATKKTVTVAEFIFTDKVNVFMACQMQSCRKKMPYSVGSTTFTCTSCGTCQKVKLAKKGATARLCAEIEGHQTRLTVFTDEMEALLKKLDLTINTLSDQIKEALLSLENITLVIDPVSNFILEVIEE